MSRTRLIVYTSYLFTLSILGVVLGYFLVTVENEVVAMASLREVKVIYSPIAEKTQSLSVEKNTGSSIAGITVDNLTDLRKELEAITQKSPGAWGVAVVDLTNDRELMINADEVFHGASVTKLVSATTVLDMIDKNDEDLNREVDGQTIMTLLTRMINRSDNDAWESLNRTVGLRAIQNLAKKLEMNNVNIRENQLTAHDVSALLKSIYTGRVLSTESREFLFAVMQNTQDETRIPAGVPDDVVVIHKTGHYDNVYHDAAIVMYEKPYILVTLSKDTAGQAKQIIPKISKAVLDYFQNSDTL